MRSPRVGVPPSRLAYFTSFYLSSLTRGLPAAARARTWPRITRYDDRWHWITTSVVPQFRRFDADMELADASAQRIFDDAVGYAAMPCVLPWSRRRNQASLVLSLTGRTGGVAAPPVRFRCPGAVSDRPVTVKVAFIVAFDESPAYSSICPGSTTNLPRLS